MDAKTKDNFTFSFIDIIRQDLGEKQWKEFDRSIITRFTRSFRKNCLRYHGVVDWVYCSPIGALIAKVLKPFSLLPDRCTRNSKFEFVIQENEGTIYKQRRYFMDEDAPFTFTSVFGNKPRVHEEFSQGLGMYLKLSVKRGDLLFRDAGYFFRVGNWRIPIPRWLSVGSFELLHSNIDERRFQVIIRIAHPLFGTLFYQRGDFYDTRSLCKLSAVPVSCRE